MIASYEDPASVVAWRLQSLAAIRSGQVGGALPAGMAALQRVHVAHFGGMPLFGPRTQYNARPEPLRGWAHLWGAVDRIRPAVVILDPSAACFTGEANHVTAVREFVGALTAEASERACGVLLVSHSNKAARGQSGSVLNVFLCLSYST